MKDSLIDQLPDFDYDRRLIIKRVYYLSGLYLTKRLTLKEHDELDQLVMNDEQCEEIFAILTHKECLEELFKAIAGFRQEGKKQRP